VYTGTITHWFWKIWGICVGTLTEKLYPTAESEKLASSSSFKIEHGYEVTCFSVVVQESDQLWILYGFRVLKVLRAAGEGHLFISPAKVSFSHREEVSFSIANILA
jgi:hypothetical protein